MNYEKEKVIEINEEPMEEFKERMRKQKHSIYFDRDGMPIKIMEWAAKIEDYEYTSIKIKEIGKYFISTVWTGVNSAIFNPKPLIFETMIFNDREDEDQDELHMYIERYSTEKKALNGHERAVKMVKAKLEKEKS